MKKMKCLKDIIACAFVLLLAVPVRSIAQEAYEAVNAESPEQVFRPEELDQMLAPIALYPDALLAQVFTAATYPLDIVAADRFAKENPGLKGEALMNAANDKDWAPSVMAMLQFPDVLVMMDTQLDWTTKLGDAFLAQQREVMDSVQRLRQRAYAQGKLTTGSQAVVTQDPQTQIIIIEQANPAVVYVPVYDPMDVYGTWWYPDYLPYSFYYPGYRRGAFLVQVFVGPLWGWRSWHCDWHRHGVFVNDGGRHIPWEHNPRFRRGAGYRDRWTAERFGARQAPTPVVRRRTPEFRNREQAAPSVFVPRGRTERMEPRGRPLNPVIEFRGHTEQPEQRIESQPAVNVPRPGTGSQMNIRPTMKVFPEKESLSVFSGAGRGGLEREESFRGHSSFESSRTQGSSSGVSRGGREGGHEEDKGGREEEGRGGHEGGRGMRR